MTSSGPPRLLAVNHTGQLSGAERVLLRVLEEARIRGWRVTCAVPEGPLLGELGAAGHQLLRLPELGLPSGIKAVGAARMANHWWRSGSRLHRAGQHADVVLANGLLTLPALRLARLRAPTVWFVHDVLVRPDRLRLLRLCRSAVNGIVAVSGAAADSVAAARVPTEVIVNGVTWPVDAAPTPSSGPPYVIGINALLAEWKGHRVLLDAMADCRNDVLLEVMGGHLPRDVGYARQLASRASAPGLRERVRLLGHVDTPVERMRGWAVAVNPSIDPEAGPLNVLEAMSLEIPVIGTDIRGTRDLLRDGRGWLVPLGDAEALARALVEVSRGGEPVHSATRLAREAIVDTYDLEIVLVIHDRLYDEVLRPPARS